MTNGRTTRARGVKVFSDAWLHCSQVEIIPYVRCGELNWSRFWYLSSSGSKHKIMISCIRSARAKPQRAEWSRRVFCSVSGSLLLLVWMEWHGTSDPNIEIDWLYTLLLVVYWLYTRIIIVISVNLSLLTYSLTHYWPAAQRGDESERGLYYY